MADLASLERALRNADAAGDTEAARTIAQAIKAKRGGSTAGNLLAGAVRGAGSIGATLLTPIDAAARALGVQNDFIGRTDRRSAMDEALRGMGADTDSTSFAVGKLGSEIAGTMGVGGVLARPLAGVLPNLSAAVGTSGFRAGAGGLGTRTAGGAITGGASAGLVDPGDAGTGAAIGGALPGVLKAAGAAGGAVGSAFRPKSVRAAEELAKSLGLTDPADIAAAAAKLRAAQEFVPGSIPTTAQVLRTPDAGILQRVVSDSAGGSALRNALAQQNVARLAALEGVAPVGVNGVREAQQNLGESVAKFATRADQAARAKTSALYESVPQDEAMLYLPDLAPIRDKFFGPGVFVGREGADRAVSAAQELSLMNLPQLSASKAGAAPSSLATAVRRAGGISIKDNGGLRGEVAGLRGDLKNLVRTTGGMSPDRMAERMYEAGYIADESADTLFAALRNDAMGSPQFSVGDDLSARFSAMRDSAMGDAPEAATVAKKVTLRELDNLRSSIGQTAREARLNPGRAREAAALESMKTALDDRVNQVVAGDGAIDEVLPIDWANKLDEARKAKVDQVQRFRTGPQASIFRTGSDGQPLVQGGEVAAKFWGNRPGIADDVSSFRKLIDDKPDLLGQFRSLITTEGAATADAGGRLTSKFVKWVDQTLPGLKKAFDADDVKTLKRIAEDIKRSEAAASAGMSRGSNTYQNAQNALNLGLLDSPLLGMAANRIPLLGSFTGPGLEALRGTARTAKAERLGGLLSDARASGDSLAGLLTYGQQPSGLLTGGLDAALPWLYRSAPVLSTSQ